jgi:hypothetical protein
MAAVLAVDAGGGAIWGSVEATAPVSAPCDRSVTRPRMHALLHGTGLQACGDCVCIACCMLQAAGLRQLGANTQGTVLVTAVYPAPAAPFVFCGSRPPFCADGTDGTEVSAFSQHRG